VKTKQRREGGGEEGGKKFNLSPNNRGGRGLGKDGLHLISGKKIRKILQEGKKTNLTPPKSSTRKEKERVGTGTSCAPVLNEGGT